MCSTVPLPECIWYFCQPLKITMKIGCHARIKYEQYSQVLQITPQHSHRNVEWKRREGRGKAADSFLLLASLMSPNWVTPGYLLQASLNYDKMGSFWHLKAIKAAFNMFFKRCWEKFFALFCTVNFYVINIFRILLNCYGLDKMEEISR